MKPTVTVTMAAYNHAAFVGLALERLADQTFRDFKVIACDDGSTDGTYNILKEYESGRLAGKLLVLTHPEHKNMGIQATRARCLEHADTELFIGHGSDDFWEPDALEYLVRLMRADVSRDFVYGQVNVVDETGANLFRFEGTVDVGHGLAAAERVLFYNTIRAPSMMFRQTCLDTVLAVPKQLCFSDWYQNVQLFLQRKPCYYRRPVVNYRVHNSNISIGRPDEFLLEQRCQVAEALLTNSAVVRYPTLKFSLLCWLAATGLLPGGLVKVRHEMYDSLVEVDDQQDRDRVVMNCWTVYGSTGEGLGVLNALPWYCVVRLFLRIGSLAACSKTHKLVGQVSWSAKMRVVGQLLSSLVLRCCILSRDVGRVLLACFRGTK